MSDKRRTQDVADSAALMGAGQLGVTPNGADQRAQSFAQSQLSDVANYATVSSQATVGANNTMTVAVDTQRASFFGNLLPAGRLPHPREFHRPGAEHSAALCARRPRRRPCSSSTSPGTSQLQAGSCLVHSQPGPDRGSGGVASRLDQRGRHLGHGTDHASRRVGRPHHRRSFREPQRQSDDRLSQREPRSGHKHHRQHHSDIAAPAFTPPRSTFLVTVALTLAAGDHYFCQTVTVSGNATLEWNRRRPRLRQQRGLEPFRERQDHVSAAGKAALWRASVIIADRKLHGKLSPLQSDFITQLTGHGLCADGDA